MTRALATLAATLLIACNGDMSWEGPDPVPPAVDGGGFRLMDSGVAPDAFVPDPGAPDAARPPDPPDSSTPPPSRPRDAGAMMPPGSPGADVELFTYDEQHTASGGAWGEALTDIVRHLPRSYGDTYYDSDYVTYGHETTHGINSHLRNYFNTTGRRANGFYLLRNRAVLVVEPGIRKSAVAAYVPSSLRGSRFSLYITGSSAWDDTPLYIFDEWVAYTNGGEVGVDRVRRGLWREGWRDAVAGQLEFTIYAIATAMAVEAGDRTYFDTYPQFREFLAWNARRAMDLYRAGAVMAEFEWEAQDRYYRDVRTSADAEELRRFVRRIFGDAWAREVLGLD